MGKRKLEKGVHVRGNGAGVEWNFDTSDPKLISRTWKGIPDCWRGAAWYSFLAASHKSRRIGRPDGELINIYNVSRVHSGVLQV